MWDGILTNLFRGSNDTINQSSLKKASPTINVVDGPQGYGYNDIVKYHDAGFAPLGWNKTQTSSGAWVYKGKDTNGNDVEYVIGATQPTKNNSTVTDTRKPSGSGGSGGGGGYSSSVTAPAPQATKVNWQGRNVDEVANELGFTNYKYEDILKLYDDATGVKFNEYDTQTKRARAENLTDMEAQYNLYLDTLRADKANAVANGVTAGTAAATQLGTMLGNASVVAEQRDAYNDVLYDLTQQRGTELANNKITANTERNAFQQYMSGLLGTYEANSVNELAARLAADAQIKSAQIGANATLGAASMGANAAQAEYDWYLDRFVEAAGGDYAKGLNNYLAYQNNTNANIAADTAAKYLMGQ